MIKFLRIEANQKLKNETEAAILSDEIVFFDFDEDSLKAIAKGKKPVGIMDSSRKYLMMVIPDKKPEKYRLTVGKANVFDFHVGQSIEEVSAFFKFNKRLKDWLNKCGSLNLKATTRIIH